MMHVSKSSSRGRNGANASRIMRAVRGIDRASRVLTATPTPGVLAVPRVAVPMPPPMHVDRQAMLHAMFVAMDDNRSSSVDLEELSSIFTDREVTDAQRWMRDMDSSGRGDGDGKLSATEVCPYM